MFQFTDDCLIGIDSLDDDHRYLFELINRVLELLKEEPTAERQTQVNAILDKLTAYADHHFIKEEEYMEQIRDPELLKQRAQRKAAAGCHRSFEFPCQMALRPYS